jgi:hypothetical protein
LIKTGLGASGKKHSDCENDQSKHSLFHLFLPHSIC